jgi:hypothetical protein
MKRRFELEILTVFADASRRVFTRGFMVEK